MREVQAVDPGPLATTISRVMEPIKAVVLVLLPFRNAAALGNEYND